jgi:hypothetical protein
MSVFNIRFVDPNADGTISRLNITPAKAFFGHR